jgi:hypothetical protein
VFVAGAGGLIGVRRPPLLVVTGHDVARLTGKVVFAVV